MSRDDRKESPASTDRRSFLTGAAALGAAVGTLAATGAQAEVKFPTQPGKFGPVARRARRAACSPARSTAPSTRCTTARSKATCPTTWTARSIASAPTRSTRSPRASNTTSPSTAKAMSSMFRIQNGHVDYLQPLGEERSLEGAAQGAQVAVWRVPQSVHRRSERARARAAPRRTRRSGITTAACSR